MPELPEFIIGQAANLGPCLADVAGSSAIALDTEFVGEDTYRPELCLVQLATPNALYVIDPQTCGALDGLWKLLVEPARTVVMHAGREEIRICNFAIGTPPANVVDVQVAAGLVGLGYPVGYGQLLQQVLGVRLSKGETLTDWRRRPLSDEQLQYAFNDVRHLLALWQRLSRKLEELGRAAWAAEEFATLGQRAIKDAPGGEKWRKLRGVSALDRRKLAIVREIFLWRDEKAARVDRPARFMLRDDLIIEIARRNPRDEGDLAALRGLGRADFAGIQAAVNRARELPPEQWPEEAERDFDPPQVALVAGLLGVVLAEFCQSMNLTVPLAATTNDLRGLVRARIEGAALSGDAPLNRGWRREHVLPGLLAVLDGQVAVRVADVRSESPFEKVPCVAQPESGIPFPEPPRDL